MTVAERKEREEEEGEKVGFDGCRRRRLGAVPFKTMRPLPVPRKSYTTSTMIIESLRSMIMVVRAREAISDMLTRSAAEEHIVDILRSIERALLKRRIVVGVARQ